MTNKDNNTKILGLHHVTALSSDAQKNVDFYAGILGLRMVKKTVNFDAPDVYHLYYGDREGYNYGHIPSAHTIKGFYGVTLNQQRHERTAEFLTGRMEHKLLSEENGRLRFSSGVGAGTLVDVLALPDGQIGRGGSGTVHHVAFATTDDSTQHEVRKKLGSASVHVTPIVDRQYFKSIYFREPGGVLFEVATNPPGMAIDEEPEHLGEALKLPPWQENNRDVIESNLEMIKFDTSEFMD